VENLPRCAEEFGKLARRIWKNLPWKTLVPIHRGHHYVRANGQQELSTTENAYWTPSI